MISMAISIEKVGSKLFTGINMLLTIEKGIRDRTFYTIHWNAEANKKIHEKLW